MVLIVDFARNGTFVESACEKQLTDTGCISYNFGSAKNIRELDLIPREFSLKSICNELMVPAII